MFSAERHRRPIITRCLSSLLPDESLLTAFNSTLPLSLSIFPSFFLSVCSPSFSLSFFSFLPSPFPAVFGAHEHEGSSPPIVSVLRGAPQLDPSPFLSHSPFPPATLFLSHPLSLSLPSPCCDRAHLLDLGCMRSESNYPIGPLSHFTVSSPCSTGFWESSSSQPLSLPSFH